MTRGLWQVTRDTWHVTCDMWHMVWSEHSLKISVRQLLRFGIDSVYWMNYWIYNYEGVYKTAPATPGLLNITLCLNFLYPTIEMTSWSTPGL